MGALIFLSNRVTPTLVMLSTAWASDTSSTSLSPVTRTEATPQLESPQRSVTPLDQGTTLEDYLVLTFATFLLIVCGAMVGYLLIYLLSIPRPSSLTWGSSDPPLERREGGPILPVWEPETQTVPTVTIEA